MQTEPTSTPQAVADLAELSARVAKLERNGRRWRMAFAALAVVVVGMGANEATKDATFGTVKASKFEVVDSKGNKIGTFGANGQGDDESVSVILRNSVGTQWGIWSPGEQVKSAETKPTAPVK